MKNNHTERALKMLDRLLKLEIDDDGFKPIVLQAKGRLALPMADVLAKVPGQSVIEKCKKIGISRQAYYLYMRGGSRPSIAQAKRLAKLTGYTVTAIRAGGHKAPNIRMGAK